MRAMLLVLIGLASAAGMEHAEARKMFRCNGSIIDTGLTIPEVIAKCGEPDSREVTSVPIRARNPKGATYVVGTATIEHWIYRRRAGEFPALLTFDMGRLRDIEFLDRR